MKRFIYDDLVAWKTSRFRKPLVLKGARQVGKTWILKEFGRAQFKNVHYVNFENARAFVSLFRNGLQPAVVLPQLAILLKSDIDAANDLIVFDEIQNVPEAITSLKYFHEEMPQLAVCAAGSLIGLTLNQASFPVGKVDMLTLSPMTFEEFLFAVDERAADVLADFGDDTTIPDAVHDHLWEQLKIYYIVGGLPEAVKRYCMLRDRQYDAWHEVRSVQKALLQGYQSDFAKHCGSVHAAHIHHVFENVPLQMSRVLDGSIGRFQFKGVIPGLTRSAQLEGPIDWLIQTGLVLKAHVVEKPSVPLRAFCKENIFKLMLFDVGMLGCMLELPVESLLNQDYGTIKGFYAENLVAQEFVAAGMDSLYSWHGHQSEIEFILPWRQSILPVEVKSGTRTQSRSLAAYAAKFSPPLRIKITARNLDRRATDCHNYPLYLAGKLARMAAKPPESD